MNTLLEKIGAGQEIVFGEVTSRTPLAEARLRRFDALAALHTRQLGIGQAGGLMPFGNANSIVLEMCRSLPIARAAAPVWAGVCATEPTCLIEPQLRALRELGVKGVVNYPTIGLADSAFRLNVEALGLGYKREIAMLRTARELGLETLPFVFNQVEARSAAALETPVLVFHLGAYFADENAAGERNDPYWLSCAERVESVGLQLKKEFPRVKLLIYSMYPGTEERTRELLRKAGHADGIFRFYAAEEETE